MVNPSDTMVSIGDIEAELQLEESAIKGGAQRYLQTIDSQGFVDTTLGQTLLKNALPVFVNAIEALAPNLQRCAPTLHNLLYSSGLDIYEIAATVTSCILSNCHSQRSHEYLKTAKAIGSALCQQLAYKRFKNAEPQLLRYVLDELKSQSTVHRHRVLNWYFGRFNTRENLTEELKIHLGIKLIESFVSSTGIVEVINVCSSYRLCFTEATLKWIAKMKLKCSILDPIVEPMLIPPVNWYGMFNGGFLLNGVGFGFPFIRANNLSLSIAQTHDLSNVQRVANILQHTPWCINRYIFRTFDSLVKAGGMADVIPNLHGVQVPPKPWGNGEPTPAQLKAWKSEAAEAYTKEHSEASRRIAMFRKLSLAAKLMDRPKFYYVWSVDFRGRYNVVQTWVSPQSDDLGKALIQFHNELPVTQDGLMALEIHMANEWGNDKCPYRERIRWVKDHLVHIRESVADPINNRWWSGADKPWQFLAAAEEYVGILSGQRSTHRIPVSADGSCNGFQHLSAMLRDQGGALAVNLSSPMAPRGAPSPTEGTTHSLLDVAPSDIYSIILSAVRELLRLKGDTYWDKYLDRKLIKRNVMTSPYSVTLEGMTQQLKDELRSRGFSDRELMFKCRALAQLVCQARSIRLSQAMGAMDWLKYVAHECSLRESPVVWITPNGFPVLQYYQKYKSKRIDLITGERRVQLMINGEGKGLDKHKQSLGIAPNFVHSMDACHLSLTVLDAHDNHGIKDFGMVHDSYGTHACSMPLLGSILRKQFVQLYSTDVLSQLKLETERRLSCELKDPPQKGTFDITEVLNSPHFFNNIHKEQ